MVIHDLNIMRIAVEPTKDDSQLIVHSNTVKTGKIAPQVGVVENCIVSISSNA